MNIIRSPNSAFTCNNNLRQIGVLPEEKKRKTEMDQDNRVEDLELISAHGHTNITNIYRTTIYEKDQNLTRKDLLQLKI